MQPSVGVVAAVFIGLLACGEASPQAEPPVRVVAVANLTFGPTPTSVHVNDVVEWRNADIFRHTVSRHKPVQQSPPTPEAGLPQARGILGQFQGARAARSRARYSDPGTLVDRHEVGSQRTGQNDGISLACGTHSSVGNGWIP